MECHLALTALSGTVVNVSVSVAKFDRFADLEDHVVDYIASVTDLKVFGCAIDFLQVDTQTYWGGTLAGPQKRAIFRSSFWLRTVALFVSQHSHGGRRCSR